MGDLVKFKKYRRRSSPRSPGTGEEYPATDPRPPWFWRALRAALWGATRAVWWVLVQMYYAVEEILEFVVIFVVVAILMGIWLI